MKTAPRWLAEKIAATGVLVLDGRITRAEADTAIAAATREHPEFGEELGTAAGIGLFGKWLREHTSGGDLFQAGLFPDLPAVMRIAPNKSARIADMTAEELDHAKNMLFARTKNMVEGAEEASKQERAAFMRLYDKVRPLLSGDKTVADVLHGLLGKEGRA